MPRRLVGFPRRDDGAPGAIEIGGVLYRGRDLRDDGLPAFAVTSKSRSWCVYDTDPLSAWAATPTQLSSAQIGVLQGFPATYPWRGSRTAQIAQAANAIPPPLAASLIDTLLPKGSTP